MKRFFTKIVGFVLVLAMILVFTSCTQQATSETEQTGADATESSQTEDTQSDTGSEDLVKVRFGLLPYQDWMPWMLADELGYFEEVGIDLEVTTFTDDITCAEAIVSGDIDVGCGNSGSGPLVLSRFPELNIVSLTCGFLGYAIMVRPDDLVTNGGTIKTYEMIYEEEIEKGVAEEEAKANAIVAACKQLEGKEIVMDRGTGSNLPFAAALEAGGLDENDVKYIDIPDVEGALAFWDGTGDFEIGGFPQVTSLSELGAAKLISAAELGGKSVNLSCEMATETYVENSMETLVKMRKVWYRVIDDIYSDDDTYMEKLAEIANGYQGTSMTAEDMRNVAFAIDPWPTADEVEDVFFEDGAKWSFEEIYGASLDYWINVKNEVEEGIVDLESQKEVLQNIHSQY